jgi:hypothetical protein
MFPVMVQIRVICAPACMADRPQACFPLDGLPLSCQTTDTQISGYLFSGCSRCRDSSPGFAPSPAWGGRARGSSWPGSDGEPGSARLSGNQQKGRV